MVVLSSQRNDVGVYNDRLCRELRALRGDGAVLPDALIGTVLEGSRVECLAIRVNLNYLLSVSVEQTTSAKIKVA